MIADRTAKNTLVQLLTIYTDPDSHNAHVTGRQTDDMMIAIADHTV